jgi:hypothetical protein
MVAFHVITKTAGIGEDLHQGLHSETNVSLALVCLRVEALYHNKRWVIRLVRISFILFYVLRWGLTVSGAVILSRKS